MPKLPQSNRRCFSRETVRQIRAIRARRGWTYAKLAAKYYCSRETIRRYCTVYVGAENKKSAKERMLKMGLDITAYRKLSIVENPEIDEDGGLVNWDSNWQPGANMDWAEKHFPGRGEGINSKAVYSWESEFQFRAGSYSGYNHWRSQLEVFANAILEDSSAFFELIEFADNEGVIGPVVSAKLLNDFSKYEDKAKEYSVKLGTESEWWFEKYQDWKNAFEYASDNGAVDFH